MKTKLLPAPGRPTPRLRLTWAAPALWATITLGVSAAPAATEIAPNKIFPHGITGAELAALLPPYCKDAQSFLYPKGAGPNADRWVALMGEDFWHIHHYCYGLHYLWRAKFITDPTEKKFVLGEVRGQYNYVLQNASPNMVLMPEIWTRMGDVQNMLGDVGAALDAYETAIARKPDYWPAYQREADMFLKAGVKARGLETLLRGIAANPGSTELRNSYMAAGGDQSRLPPQPAPTSPAAASAPEVPASAADVQPASASGP